MGIAALFLAMLAAPCIVAAMSSRRGDEEDASDAAEPVRTPLAVDDVLDQPLTLVELTVRAESDALFAQEMAREAQRAAMTVDDVFDRPLTLAELAARAEGDALFAQEMAREAQRAAMAAMAHAARLRADAAIQAAEAAEEAIWGAQANYLPAEHPSLDFPRSRVRRAAA